MTNRELLETFQYGDVIHFERFQEYSQIAGNNIFPLTKENFLFELENIILTFIHQISYVDCINREELQRLGEVIDF
jgi:hypothetical protein